MRLGLILGDQLSDSLATLRVLDAGNDVIVMAEVPEEATYVRHHKQKIALLFSAMRHFAARLQDAGWQVRYYDYRQSVSLGFRSLVDVLAATVKEQNSTGQNKVSEIVLTRCGEYHLQHAIDHHWSDQLGLPVSVYEDDRFISTPEEFAQWAEGRKQLRMEYFYREMRRKTGLLMEAEQPLGGQWNFDHDNRAAYKREVPLPPPLTFTRSNTDQAVAQLVEQEFSGHPGAMDSFINGSSWATTRQQALQALIHFIEHRLPHFGRYQDAMISSAALGNAADTMFHSLLSPYINCGLLEPMEVCEAAAHAFHQGQVPLEAAEGFIRQIIGWREFVRGIYWNYMPQYAGLNGLQNNRSLPAVYWHGKTNMHCMKECFRNTFANAYAHHIQRLMVTGNFALLTGVNPQEICDWYLAVYADAYDWVELPNTLGMVMHADGGLLGSKPYCASGKYIARQSDYCRHCSYDVNTAEKDNSCPFNSLYWHFLQRHRQQFEKNPRMSMMYRSFDRMNEEKKAAIISRAENCLKNIDDL
ncbi:MAG: cryptochrome/photolyase family protein [Oceanospirillaceae bacterium]|nr:cryptochrome/photolyase family protein [Oceanospirillaceae bacterium]